MLKKITFLAVILIAVVALAACAPAPTQAPEQAATQAPAEQPTEAAAPTEAPQVAQSNLVFGLAVHSNPAEDSFWGVVAKGAQDAADAYGVTLKVGGSGDPTEQAQLVETYVSDKVDGLIVSLANPDALKDAVKRATDAGIPVITINSGVDVYKELGAITHVGQAEFVAEQMKEIFRERFPHSRKAAYSHQSGRYQHER